MEFTLAATMVPLVFFTEVPSLALKLYFHRTPDVIFLIIQTAVLTSPLVLVCETHNTT